MAHAELSPSSAVRWMTCAASVALNRDQARTSSSFADEGTAAHFLASECLSNGVPAAAHLGEVIVVDTDPAGSTGARWVTMSTDDAARGFVVDDEMAANVQRYLDYVGDLVKSTGGELMVEQELSIEHLTQEPGAKGTSDVVILADTEIIIVDLKYGRGERVDAEGNPQLRIYALAAYNEFSVAYDVKRVRYAIHQPRLHHVSEESLTVDELQAFAATVTERAAATRCDATEYVVSEKGCRWCAAKAECPAIRAEVMAAFEDIAPKTAEPDELATAMSKVDLIEGWIKAVRARVDANLKAGIPVPGWKLVQGKQGNRAWRDAAEAETLLKTMRVPHDQMYDYSVVSPTTAEKLAAAGTIGPRQWPKLQALITRSEGKPTVAPESDKRPALVTSAVGDFDDVTDLA